MENSGVSALVPSRSLIDSVAETISHRDRETLHLAVTQLLVEFLPARTVALYRFIAESNEQWLTLTRIERDLTGGIHRVPATAPPAPEECHRWRDAVEARAVSHYQSVTGEFVHLFPVESGRDLVGLFVIQAATLLPEREVLLVRSVMRILRSHMELLDYGERDTLTQLLNRKTFESKFDKLRRRLAAQSDEESPQESWLGILDIDKFKSINDQFGHLFGDEVLLLLSQLMQQCFRGADQLFRFGGEEFVIMLDNATAAGALIAYERMRAAAGKYLFPQVGQVTVSIGYSQICPTDAPASALERADAALYHAKHSGRNRVCHFEALVADGALRPTHPGGDAELF